MPSGAIQFVADTTQFNAPLAEASKAALNVAASAEEARQRIVQAYQQQVRAAQDAGASQSQLTSITNRASSQLASVTEDNARRYINAIDRMEERTRRFNAARASLGSAVASPASSFSLGGYTGEAEAARELATAVEGVSSAHTRGVSSAVQFGSVIRGLEGNFSRNVRAAEAFGSTLSFLTPVIEAAFPVIGAVTLGYALVEMGKHAYDAWENIVNLRSAIEGLNQLQVNVDAGHNRAGEQQENSIESILAVTANRSTSLQQRLSFQSQQPIDLSSYFYSDQFKKLPDDVKGTFEQTYKNVAPADAQARIQQITKTINDLQAALTGVKSGSIGAFLPVINGSGPSSTRNPADYYQAQLTIAQQVRTGLTDANDVRTASLQSTQTEIGAAQAQEAREAQQKAHEAALKAAEEFRLGLEADAAVAKAWQAYENNNAKILSEDSLEKFKTGGLSEGDTKQINQAGKDSAARIAALSQSIVLTKQDSQAQAEAILQMQLATGQITKLDAARVTAAMHLQQYNEAMAALKEQAANIQTDAQFNERPEARQAAAQVNANQQTALAGQFRIQSAQDSQNVNPASSSGVVGVEDALNEFADAVRNTSATLKQFTSSALSGINKNAVDGLFGQRTNFRGLGLDLARQGTGALLGKAEGGILSGLGFGGAPNGTQSNPLYVRISNAVSGAFGGSSSGSGSNGDAGSSPLGGLFKKGSGGVGGFFKGLLGGGGGSSGTGFDGLDDAQGIAMGAGDAETEDSGFSGLLSALPGLAIGGGADANSSYLVGERGPEILTMGTQPGRVIPNSQIGGVTHNHYYDINAQGSNDPAALHAAVRKAIPQAVAASTQVQHQRSLRRPQKG